MSDGIDVGSAALLGAGDLAGAVRRSLERLAPGVEAQGATIDAAVRYRERGESCMQGVAQKESAAPHRGSAIVPS